MRAGNGSVTLCPIRAGSYSAFGSGFGACNRYQVSNSRVKPLGNYHVACHPIRSMYGLRGFAPNAIARHIHRTTCEASNNSRSVGVTETFDTTQGTRMF